MPRGFWKGSTFVLGEVFLAGAFFGRGIFLFYLY